VDEAASEPVPIDVDDATRVSGLLLCPPRPNACYVLAHGAGAGMHHPFMESVASGLAALGIASLRYQFPYMEQHAKRPDSPARCHATVRAAVAAARRRVPTLPLIAGGKSFGGRMTSQAQAEQALEGIRGLVFLGFPLHAPKQPSDSRAEHLLQVRIPMLFLQGARDEFAESTLIHALVERLGQRATLKVLPDADHSFHVPVRSGRTDAEVQADMLRAVVDWTLALISPE
jgi:predicted alpha/beta-hydrolase family hydrolase